MSEQDKNVAVYRRLIDECFNKGDLDAVDEIAAPNFVEHEVQAEGIGPDVLKEAITFLRTAMPDLHFEIEDMAVVGDRIWSRIEATGTHDGPIFGRPASGNPVRMGFMDVSRFENGMIVEHWGIPDNLAMLLQMGIVSLPAPEPAAD
jgi:predicted ester cyclase